MQMRGGTAAPQHKVMRTSTSMAGLGRMSSLVQIINSIAANRVAGSYLEAGVWRGGMSILATAALQLAGLGERPIYLCDSFAGLPLPREGSLGKGESFYATRLNGTLAVGEQRVLDNFDRFSVDRRRVTTVPGYFVHSLPGLREQLLARGEKLALLRLDGDIYDSTADILYHLCTAHRRLRSICPLHSETRPSRLTLPRLPPNVDDLVSVGGYVVIDDFGWRDGIKKLKIAQGHGNATAR